ncbi:prolyl-tRNA synthetase associated domain-containing protein [Pseudomonas sp. GX19020]|uniref:prolyl-tRNA synthetase associated domain-containing protein n=1 Tax=Pseudomonas sp. GX19020 TaxID=2942277 RepID=UPI002019CD9B|nr:prolyl-tRNA synthetase associated domain-containing protein [Pseudomonas sp. GX19020]MCL4068795.1 prolyl-tRNA synthetase associated domain-containing protein [Pseudomonas sp. GX19020]
MKDAIPANPTDEAARAQLFARFRDLGIAAPTVPYPAHRTVEEGKALRGAMAGTFTKNLLVKDKKARHFLLSFHEDRVIDLKTLHRRIGAKGQVGFASAQRVQEYLDVRPGALTPLGLINDATRAVTPVIDASLMGAEQLNFHPLINTESTGLHPKELLSFILSCGQEPLIVDFDTPLPA